LKVRETLVGQRTLLVNTLRGHAAEFGVIAAKGLGQVGPLLAAIEQEHTIPPEAKDMAALLGRQLKELDARIKEIEVKLAAAHQANEVSPRLATIPGVGPVTALTLALEIDPKAFESGRHLAAWAGLTPKEHSTGGKQRLSGISRAGNETVACLARCRGYVGDSCCHQAGKQADDRLVAGTARAQAAQSRRRGACQ